MKVRHARVEEAIEALDESVDFDPKLVRTHDSAVYGGVERRCVSPGSQNADTLHGCSESASTWSFIVEGQPEHRCKVHAARTVWTEGPLARLAEDGRDQAGECLDDRGRPGTFL
jgi:hypothetical protein